MYEISHRFLRSLQSSITQFHPQTASLLALMESKFGTEAAFQAAEIIVCLQERVNACGSEAAGLLTEDDLDSFPYFQIMQDNPAALDLMVDVLERHARECALFAASVRN